MMIFILDNIRSASNIGSVFRTSDAFGIKKIWLCGICATPPNKEIFKTALGATESVEWQYEENIIDLCNRLKDDGYTLISIEQAEKSVPLHTYLFDQNKKYACILGNEIEGVQPHLLGISDNILEIPQYGKKKSLNVAVVAGVVGWEFCKTQL
jgi:23S rRNA (guanosine2251-2'-O)-methyltransferase